MSKKIIGTNIDDGFTFPMKPSRSGNSSVLTIPSELVQSNQVPLDEILSVTIKRKQILE